MADVGPSIVVAVTGILSFGVGFAADMVRHRIQRKDRLQDERISVYGRYISASRQSATLLSGLLSETEPLEEIMARSRQAEELVGPVHLYSNKEVRDLLEKESDALTGFTEMVLSLTNSGVNPGDAVIRAWGTHMRVPMDQLEDAMRRHLDLNY